MNKREKYLKYYTSNYIVTIYLQEHLLGTNITLIVTDANIKDKTIDLGSVNTAFNNTTSE